MFDIKKPETWPPGAVMQYKSTEHVGLGVVVANRNGSIAVLWDSGCHTPFLVYKCEQLNPRVISRAF